MKKYIPFIYSLLLLVGCNSVKENPEITSDEIYEHIKYLASDELTGRYPGTHGDSLAVEYIVNSLEKSGFKKEDIEVQDFKVITGIKNLGGNELNIDGTNAPDTLYAPFPFSDAGEISGEMVFAGYGFQIDTKEIKWDDYKNVNVTDKIVVLLRGEPYIDSTKSAYRTYSSDINKALTAKDNGAKGVILVSGPAFDAKDELVELKGKKSNIGIPVVQVKKEFFNSILEGKNVDDIEKELNKSLQANSFDLNKTADLKLNLEIDKRTTYNVIATLNSPINSSEYVVLGAHYDHLGMGGENSSSRRPDTVAVHNGADDNASGVSAVLEVAEKLYTEKENLKKNFVFVFFGAEEMGLLGSKFYVENSNIDMAAVDAMVNLDMVGRMKPDTSIQIGGTGTSIESKDILNDINEHYGFKIAMSDAGYGPSDHASFYAEDIPVLFISSGAHQDYHTPEDDLGTINVDGIQMIANYASDILLNLSDRAEKLTYQEAGPKSNPGGGRSYKVALGIMPDFTSTENNGLGVDFVTPGKPGNIGGMKKGDLIVAIDGKPIKNIHEYMFRMGKHEVGDRITVTVKREGKEEILLIQL